MSDLLRRHLRTPRLGREAIVTPPETFLLERVSTVFEVREPGSAGHLRGMAAVTALLAERTGLSPPEILRIRVAASLHDIGKLTVSNAILAKPGALSLAERAAVERHALTGHQMLTASQTPVFRLAATIALSHHERWDGGGYPLGLRGEDIPLVGRLAAVADVFDALLSTRPYRPALDLAEATGVLRAGRGSHFDPRVIDALLRDVDGALTARAGATGDGREETPVSFVPVRPRGNGIPCRAERIVMVPDGGSGRPA